MAKLESQNTDLRKKVDKMALEMDYIKKSFTVKRLKEIDDFSLKSKRLEFQMNCLQMKVDNWEAMSQINSNMNLNITRSNTEVKRGIDRQIMPASKEIVMFDADEEIERKQLRSGEGGWAKLNRADENDLRRATGESVFDFGNLPRAKDQSVLTPK